MNIKIPKGMLEAALEGLGIEVVHARRKYVKAALEAALRWLAENPIVPTDEQAKELWNHPKVLHGSEHYAKAMARDWQRMMFHAPEPEYIGSEELGRFCARYQRIDEAVIEAYRRGKESK